MKTRIVKFTYGTAKDAELLIPTEACSLHDVAVLIRESYLKWMFSHNAIMSDECVVSSIGKSNFFAGALGGWETRLDAKDFALLKEIADDDMGLAIATVKFRKCNTGITDREAWREAAKNEVLSENVRKAMISLADNEGYWANR